MDFCWPGLINDLVLYTDLLGFDKDFSHYKEGVEEGHVLT